MKVEDRDPRVVMIPKLKPLTLDGNS